MLILQLNSENLLDATLDMDGVAVAEEIEKIHNEHVSVIQYNNENSLSSVLTIAYLSAMQYYFKPIREFPTGRGLPERKVSALSAKFMGYSFPSRLAWVR